MIDLWLGALTLDSLVVHLMVLLVATAMVSLLVRLLLSALRRRADATGTPWDDALVNSMSLPARVLVWLVGVALMAEVAASGAIIERIVVPVRYVGVIACMVWFLLRFINQAQANIIAEREAKGRRVDRSATEGLAKLLQLTVIVIAVLVSMQTLGFSIAGVLTFGGIGGIAIGFAAKDMLANFFGGLLLYLDRPFAVGDWVRSPDRELEGVVETIGWRITCIRNFESRPLYVPNASFATIAIENVSRMTNRRIYETIGIRYDDAAAIKAIVDEARAYLQEHPEIDQEQTLMVSFTTFAPSSLDFFVYCFTRTQSGLEYYRVKQEIMLYILDIISKHGAQCAFPTTTMYFHGTPPTTT